MGEANKAVAIILAPMPAMRFYERNERAIAIGAFVAGFLFDVFTLPRVDSWRAIGQQAVYLAAITAVLVHMLCGKPLADGPKTIAAPKRWYYRYRVAGVHFLFGSLLNLYTIYYFKSASLLVSFSFMLVLVLLLAANESKRLRSPGLAFKFALLALCVLSFAAHVVPIAAGSIGTRVFLASLLAGSIPLIGVWLYARARAPDLSPPAGSQVLAPLGIVLLGFTAFYLLKLIPPVPLSIPFMGVYHSVERTAAGYRLTHERLAWRFWHNGDQEFVARPGDSVYVFFRIFSPTRFSDRVLVRWYWKDGARGWVAQETIPIHIVGGRAEGFRGYGYKSSYRPGEWRVQVETTDGREIGRIYFHLALAPAAPRDFTIDVQ
jgi:hypothetical protein